jgi:hypothetical protein
MEPNMPTMQEINRQKWARMRKIIEILKQKPLTFNEIRDLFTKEKIRGKILERSLQRYLEELKALGLITYNGQYHWAETKRVFQNKAEYEAFLKHSETLTFSGIANILLDEMNPYFGLDMLIFEPEKDKNLACLMQHIKTGYPDVFNLMEKYRRTMDKTGLAQTPNIPKFRLPTEPALKDNAQVVVLDPFKALRESGLKIEVSDKEVKELVNLRDLLIGKIYMIIAKVKHGTPLQGKCDLCPELTIKE